MFLTWNFLSEAAELKLSLLIGLLPFAPWVANDQSGFLELRECTHYGFLRVLHERIARSTLASKKILERGKEYVH